MGTSELGKYAEFTGIRAIGPDLHVEAWLSDVATLSTPSAYHIEYVAHKTGFHEDRSVVARYHAYLDTAKLSFSAFKNMTMQADGRDHLQTICSRISEYKLSDVIHSCETALERDFTPFRNCWGVQRDV